MVSAMGTCKWMSNGSKRKGTNLRAPATAKTQVSGDTVQIHWTPVFARGKVHIHVCDPSREGPEYPVKLNDSDSLARFVRHVLPGVLDEMREAHGWPNIPRTIVHDKASYMVSPSHQRLNVTFANSLVDAGFASWLGSVSDTTEWLVAKWGDMYLHETVISHIRRLLEAEYRTQSLNEPVARFTARMKQVEAHLNSPDFRAAGGRGLDGLARDLLWRCDEVVRLEGERLPK